MNETIIDLYRKEREYQKQIFGDYSKSSSLNLASFLTFIEEYIQKAKKNYVGKWSKDLPPWLISCKEHYNQGSAPVDTYAELIKVFALTGAAIEVFANIDVNEWRKEGIKSKWDWQNIKKENE